MSVKMFVFLLIGTLLMGVPIALMAKKNEIRLWKSVAATGLLTVFGYAGTYLMFYIENHWFGGVSFYGAVFFVPIAFIFVADLLRIPYKKIMDFCAVGECIMLALMKVQCFLGECCFGRDLFTLADGTVIRFPSRLVESAVALTLFALLFIWAMKQRKRGELYGWYLILYGSARFVLNFMRKEYVTTDMVIPFGHLWSLVAIGLGLFWLIRICKERPLEKEPGAVEAISPSEQDA